MTINRGKLVAAAFVSAILLGILAMLAHVRPPDLSKAEPEWLVAVFVAHLVMVSARGLALRALAPRLKRTETVKWVHLAARHQLVFSIVPAGAGDVGFPYSAKRIVGLEPPEAVRTIAQFRLRDLILVGLMGLTGGLLIGLPGPYTWAVIAVAIPILWMSDDIAAGLFRVSAAVAPHSRLDNFLRTAAEHESPTANERIARTFLAVFIWSSSVAAVMAAFRAIGTPIQLAEVLIFIAAVNLAGAVSLSIAGLGVSEAGATAALVATGKSLQQASSIALVVRPLLLLSIVCASLLLDAAISTIDHRSRLPEASRR
jgi:uncharacterized membrane protein YbhN (UPF0104 family)